MKRGCLILLLIIILTPLILASDVLVWQGQYYTGTTFNTGTYEFNFSIYDNPTGGNICYSNTTNLTTGNFGEWKIEPAGVCCVCNNASKDYFLEIKIDGGIQGDRKRLTMFNFLRKNVNEVTTGTLQTNTQIVAPVVNATTVVADEINITSNANILGTLRGHSPLKLGDEINFIKTDGTITSALYNAPRALASALPSVFEDSLIHDIIEETNDYGMQECWWDENTETMQMCISGAYLPFRATTISRSLQIVGNTTNKPVDESFTLCEGNNYIDCNTDITGADLLVEDDIEAIGSIFSQENITAQYFMGDGSLLTNLPGIIPVYLETDLNATNADYTTLFTVALTPSKMNIVEGYLAQSSSASGAAIQNRVIINESGPIGYCNFVTQTQAGSNNIDNIVVSTDSADAGVTAMGLDLNVPFINTVTCTILADANQKNLIIQFQSENTNIVTTYAGSYYTNAVN